MTLFHPIPLLYQPSLPAARLQAVGFPSLYEKAVPRRSLRNRIRALAVLYPVIVLHKFKETGEDRKLPPKHSSTSASVSSSAMSDYYYNCGYQAATEEYYCKVRQIEEERQCLLDLERKMKSIFDSYVTKASVELSLIHGEVRQPVDLFPRPCVMWIS